MATFIYLKCIVLSLAKDNLKICTFILSEVSFAMNDNFRIFIQNEKIIVFIMIIKTKNIKPIVQDYRTQVKNDLLLLLLLKTLKYFLLLKFLIDYPHKKTFLQEKKIIYSKIIFTFY